MTENEELEERQAEESGGTASEAAPEAGEAGQEAAPSGEEAQEESSGNEEAVPEEPAQPEKKKSNIKGVLRKILMTILYLLLVLVILFEAGAVYLWYRYDTLAQTGEQRPAQRTVSSSSYANWSGTFRPSDWPEAESVQAGLPPELFGAEEAEPESDEPAEP